MNVQTGPFIASLGVLWHARKLSNQARADTLRAKQFQAEGDAAFAAAFQAREEAAVLLQDAQSVYQERSNS